MKGLLVLSVLILLAGCVDQGIVQQSNDTSLENIVAINETETQPITDSTSEELKIWKPSSQSNFQWQLIEPLEDLSVQADIYDIDLFDNDKEMIDRIHMQGSKAVCYISVGSWEDWRDDADIFPPELLGDDYEGWEGERWLDISNEKLKPIIEKRLDLCKEKGFDAVEPDNIDVYQQDSGFDISYEDQLIYNKWLANEAHKRGLAIALKNDGDQVNGLAAYFDFAITEDCFAYDECDLYIPFIEQGKPVFTVEYTDEDMALTKFCSEAKQKGFTGILKNRDLDSWVEFCD